MGFYLSLFFVIPSFSFLDFLFTSTSFNLSLLRKYLLHFFVFLNIVPDFNCFVSNKVLSHMSIYQKKKNCCFELQLKVGLRWRKSSCSAIRECVWNKRLTFCFILLQISPEEWRNISPTQVFLSVYFFSLFSHYLLNPDCIGFLKYRVTAQIFTHPASTQVFISMFVYSLYIVLQYFSWIMLEICYFFFFL